MHTDHWTSYDPRVTDQAAQEYLDRSRVTVPAAGMMPGEIAGTVLRKRNTSALYGGELSTVISNISKAGEEDL